MPKNGVVTGRRDRAGPAVAGLAVAGAAALVWFGLGYVRYRNGRAGASDLGIFDQASWLMAGGHRPFVTSIGIDIFADHVSPVLVIFAGLYRLAATPAWLLAVQALCLGATVVPLRKLADELDVARWVPTVAVVLSAPLLSAAVYDVHPIVFATPAVAWALLASARGEVRQVTMAGLVVALCRADAVTALVGIAVVSAPSVRRRLLTLVPVPLVASVVIPRWLGTWQTFHRYYPRLGSSWFDAGLHPWRLAAALVSAGSLRQLLWWLLPVGFLPLLRPRWVLALVAAGLPLLLSSWPGIVVPWYHHAAFLVPIAVTGALHGWKRLQVGVGAVPGHPRLAGALLVAGLVAGLAVASPLSAAAPPTVRLVTALKPAPRSVMAAIAAVRPGEGVSAQNGVLGHLGHRRDAYIWPCPFRLPQGSPSCHHHELYGRASRVDVVVLVGRADLRALAQAGFTRITRSGDVTVARRGGTKRSP